MGMISARVPGKELDEWKRMKGDELSWYDFIHELVRFKKGTTATEYVTREEVAQMIEEAKRGY